MSLFFKRILRGLEWILVFGGLLLAMALGIVTVMAIIAAHTGICVFIFGTIGALFALYKLGEALERK